MRHEKKPYRSRTDYSEVPREGQNLGEEWRIEVTNQSGTLLFRMDFIVAEMEAIPPFFPA